MIWGGKHLPSFFMGLLMTYFYTNFHLFKNNIFLRGYRDGRRFKRNIPLKPYLFIQSKNANSKYRTLSDDPVEKIDFENVYEARDFLRQYQGVADLNIYGLTNYIYAYINDEFKGEIDYDPAQISVVSIDIEVAADEGFPDVYRADKPITAISLRKNGKSVVLGCGDYTPKSEDVMYVKCRDEKNLLVKFLSVWNHADWIPDVVTGWNIEHFDIPYLYNRIVNLLGEREANKLSPWEIVEPRDIIRGKSASRGGKDIESRVDKLYDIIGITSLDYLELYKKFSFTNQESYRLDHIANVELGERKLDYSEYESLLELYKQDYEKFIDYNLHDVLLVDRLEDKLGLIKQVFAIAYDAKVNYLDTMTTVRPWDIIIHNYLLNKNIVIPLAEKKTVDSALVGGYVKEPKLGMHKWVVSFDLNSLYPHLIMQYNISPETYLGKNVVPSIEEILAGEKPSMPEHATLAANGCMYRRDKQGFLPELMQKMYDDRVLYKKKMLEAKQEYQKNPTYELEKQISRYHNLQLAKKIQLNSAYGALGNQYFRWFDLKHAEAITMSGQLAIRWIETRVNAFMNKMLKTKNRDYVIASDTDSIYVVMDKVVEAALPNEKDTKHIVSTLDKFIEAKVQSFIDQTYEELALLMNAYQQKMKMKRESIADKGIWTAKKKYILNVWNNEGVQYSEAKLKMMGIEAVRSSTPSVCRDRIKKALDIIMNEDEASLIKFIDEFRTEFYKMPYEDIAFPRGCKGMNDYKDVVSIYKKATPIHVRGALLYNKLLKDKDITTIDTIKNGDKIKFCYLKLPNPIRENVISTLGPLPKQFGLDKYIDYNLQFQKSFLDPISIILTVIDWSHEKTNSLESFWD